MTFSPNDTQTLLNIMKKRRDVRGNRFISTPLEDEKIQLILEAALAAPSVGYSQPWEFVLINDSKVKNEVYENFISENKKAKDLFSHKPSYENMKLEGILEAPLNIAVLYTPEDQLTLGKTSMDKMGEYSVVFSIENKLLIARKHENRGARSSKFYDKGFSRKTKKNHRDGERVRGKDTR